jgi:hypothetical protein
MAGFFPIEMRVQAGFEVKTQAEFSVTAFSRNLSGI